MRHVHPCKPISQIDPARAPHSAIAAAVGCLAIISELLH